MTNIIERPAGDKSKGFDTQVFRAIWIILDKINSGSETVYCALEVIEDVFLMEEVSNGLVRTTLEEDKNYSSNFSFRSEPVRNTLVSFFDQYIQFNKDPALSLCFYAQTDVASEVFSKKDKDIIKGLEDKHFGKKAILKSLNEGADISDEDMAVALLIFKNEYANQYFDRKDKKQGYKLIVEGLSISDFRGFLL